VENLKTLVDSLYLLKPEIAISCVLVLVITIDLIMHKNKTLLPYVALVGFLITASLTVEQYSFNTSLTQNLQKLFVIDAFGAFFKLVVILTSCLIVFFSLISKEVKEAFDRHGEYYALICGMIIGMFFMISSADLIMIYLSLELVSLSSYILAGFTKNSLRNSEASLKYLIFGSVSSGIMLFGISIIFGLTGTTNLLAIKSAIAASGNSLTFLFASLLVFAGIGYKISAAPFHFWTPDVYEGAPVAITAYLSIASKAAGFALLIRFITLGYVKQVDMSGSWQLVVNYIDWKKFFTIISILTMTLGNFAALWQDNIKRMLAYSSIAHAGYLLLGVVVLTNQGVSAVVLYFTVYAIMNLGAFLVVMLIANKIGSEDIDDYKGLGYATPFLGVCMAIFLISLTGLPPTAGFIGKLYLFTALIDAKMIPLAVIAIINSVVSLYYYIRVLKNMFLSQPKDESLTIKTSLGEYVIVLALAIPVIVFGIYFTPIVNLAKNSVAMFLQ
jgi:NADH-quinone oxidoreductase subunit N